MSYINLNETSTESNSEVHVSFTEEKLEVYAKTDLIIELTYGECEFTMVLPSGSTLRYRKGDPIALTYEPGSVAKCIAPNVRNDQGDFSIKYQRHYKDAVVATVDLFHDWDNGCNLISFQLHNNDGSFKGNRSSQPFSLVLHKNNPLVRLLKKARRKGAGAVNFTPDGVFMYMPGEDQEQQRTTSKKTECLNALVSPLFGSATAHTEVLKKFGIEI